MDDIDRLVALRFRARLDDMAACRGLTRAAFLTALGWRQ